MAPGPPRKGAVRIKEILDRKGAEVVTIALRCTVQDAIRKLCENRIGALVVVGEDGALAGIVSERDIMMDCGYQCSQLEALADPQRRACPRFVEDIMTRDVVKGSLDDELEHVMALMTRKRIRHLPVVDRGVLAGIVSIGDVVDAHLTQTASENTSLMRYITGALDSPA